MKITFFMEDYYLGGLDTFIINLINNWPDDSDQLTLICNRKHTGLDLIRAKVTRSCKIVTHDLLIFSGFFELTESKNAFDKLIKLILKLLSPILRYLFLIYNILALRGILLKNNPDRLMIIHGGYPGGDSCRAASISWGLFSKKPLSIHNFHGIVLKPGWHIKIQEFLIDTLVSRYTKFFVTVSAAAAHSMLSRDGISKKDKITYIYNGIVIPESDRHSSRNGDLRLELNIPKESLLCLMLGSYHRHKNFDKGHSFLLQVFKKVIQEMPQAHLLSCGFGAEESIKKVQKLVLEAGLEKNIHLLGFRKDVPCLLGQTDILLIASQVFESFCLVGIEAMAYQVPVVATKVGAIPEVILNGQGGYCVDRGDINTYSGYVIRLLKDISLRKEQGEKGFRRYKDFFTGQRMAEEYARLIHNG